MIESAVDEGAPRLGDRQPQRFQFGRLFGLIHGGAVLGDDLELRRLVASGCHQAEVGDGDAALGRHHLAVLEQVDTAVGADGRASEIVGQHRGGHLEDAAIDAGDLVANLGFLFGQIKWTAQRHGTEGLSALLKCQFELAQLCCGPVDGQARRKSAGLFERTGGGEDVGTERTRHRLRQQLGSERDVVFAADFSLQRGSVWQQNSQRCAQAELGGGTIGQLIGGNVDTRDFNCLLPSLRYDCRQSKRPVLDGDITYLQQDRFGRGRGRSRGSRGLARGLREIHGAIGSLFQGNDRVFEKHLRHIDGAAHDGRQAVLHTNAINGGQRSGSVGGDSEFG